MLAVMNAYPLVGATKMSINIAVYINSIGASARGEIPIASR
jgi:hypothetical protein